MPSHVEKLPTEPIVMVHLSSDFNPAVDLPKSIPEYLKLLATVEQPVFWIVDLSPIQLDVDGIIIGANMLTRAENPLYHHPKVRQIIYVTVDPILRAAVDGLKSTPFGEVQITAADTLEDALRTARGS